MRTLLFVQFLVVCSFIGLSKAHAADPIAVCPLETETVASVTFDLKAVMRSYRDHLNEADTLVRKSYQGDAQARAKISVAISEIQLVVDCANYVHQNYSGSMIAPVINTLTGNEKDQLLAEYEKVTLDFLDATKKYRDLLISEQQKLAADQNYQAAFDQSLVVRDLANKAHRKF